MGEQMSALSIILLVLCILEAILIVLLIQKRPKTQDVERKEETMLISEIEKAFMNNGYEAKNLSKDSLEEHLRTYRLRIQNVGYEKAEQRVVDKMDGFLYELWRLKHREHNKIADNLLNMIIDTAGISLTAEEEVVIKKDTDMDYYLPIESRVGDKQKVIIPAIYYNKALVKKGKIT